MNSSNFLNCLAIIKLLAKLLLLISCVRWQFLMTAFNALNSLKCFYSDKQCTDNIGLLIRFIQ